MKGNKIMTVHVIGKMDVSFTDKATGNEINGVNVYYTYPINSTHGDGLCGEKKFMKDVDSKEFEVDTEYDFQFDNKGRLNSYEVA